MIMLLGLALIAGGLFLSVYSFGRFRKNATIEFEGMQPGGVVGFDTADQAARHDMMKRDRPHQLASPVVLIRHAEADMRRSKVSLLRLEGRRSAGGGKRPGH